MILGRRRLLQAGLLCAAGLLKSHRGLADETEIVEIEMRGSTGGAAVWFDPVGLLVPPGATVRWVNADPANSHTATAYHPANGDRPRRIPEDAEPWDSGYLLPGETFSVQLRHEGVYDYVCVPHEMAGMVGRIVVGRADSRVESAGDLSALPEAVRAALPSVERILRHGAVPGGH